MAVVERQIPVAPERVFEVLSDGWQYALWVVGTSHIRAVGVDWPRVGSKVHHATGAWPVLLRDETEVVACDPPRSLTLIARGRPWGEARVRLDLTPQAGGTLVRIDEEPVRGLGKTLNSPVTEALLKRRNVEGLARLSALAERPTSPAS